MQIPIGHHHGVPTGSFEVAKCLFIIGHLPGQDQLLAKIRLCHTSFSSCATLSYFVPCSLR